MNSFLHCFKRSPTISRSDLDGFRLYSDTCSVIQPANGCSACRLLVENSIKNNHRKGSTSDFGTFLSFSFLFSVCDGKRRFNAETNNFDQQTASGAPVRWSKYTTDTACTYKGNNSSIWSLH